MSHINNDSSDIKKAAEQADSIQTNNMHPNNEEPVLINDPAQLYPDNPSDSYEGRKHDPEIDGPQQESQETDEIYADPRKEENLPPGGKNVGDLNAYDLSQKGNE